MAKKTTTKAKSSGTLTGFIIGFLLGVIVTGIGVFIITKTPVPFVNRSSHTTNTTNGVTRVPDPNTSLVSRSSDPSETTPPSSPLPTSVTPLPPPRTETPSVPVVPHTTPSTPTAATIYYLQAGAYRVSGQADELKAKLLLFGFNPVIQAGTIEGGAIYRVRVGPFNNQQDLDSARAQLSLQGLDTSVVKLDP